MITYSGKLCKYGHDDGGGKSTRYKCSNSCKTCHRLWMQVKGKTPEYITKQKARSAAWYKVNAGKQAADKAGLDVTTLPTKLGGCQLCGSPVRISLDHDHETKKFRGWLCGNCNSGIGHFKDDPFRLERAALYLRAARDGNRT